jgi:hypothetical protein
MSKRQVTVGEGKYTIVFDESTGKLYALRYGAGNENGGPWRNLVGDGMVLAMMQEIERLQEELAKLKESQKALTETKKEAPVDPGSTRIFY